MKLKNIYSGLVFVSARPKPDVLAGCGNWPEFECRAQIDDGPCGGYCAENDQCLEKDQSICPYDDQISPQRANCHKILDPSTCALATSGARKSLSCAGYCLKYTKEADGTAVLDWDSGLCLNNMEICPEATRKFVVSIADVPCEARRSCHACYQLNWSDSSATEPDCVWDMNQCRSRAETETQTEFNYGLCSDPRVN